jgi:hypothetical protein
MPGSGSALVNEQFYSFPVLTHHLNQPYRGAGMSVLLGLFALKLFARQHKPEVQFPSVPVAYPITCQVSCVS